MCLREIKLARSLITTARRAGKTWCAEVLHPRQLHHNPKPVTPYGWFPECSLSGSRICRVRQGQQLPGPAGDVQGACRIGLSAFIVFTTRMTTGPKGVILATGIRRLTEQSDSCLPLRLGGGLITTGHCRRRIFQASAARIIPTSGRGDASSSCRYDAAGL